VPSPGIAPQHEAALAFSLIHRQPDWLPETFIVYPLALKKTLMCERKELLALPPACWIAKSSAGAKGEECFVDDDVHALLQRVDCSGAETPSPISAIPQSPPSPPFPHCVFVT
jgi:hypothetical protein